MSQQTIQEQAIQKQTFQDPKQFSWQALEEFPGTQILPLAEPVPQGSIHRLQLEEGTVIPVHTHPCDEYVYVLSGSLKTGEQLCEAGTFWYTPAGVEQGPHTALTDVELLTVRLGPMGTFEAVVEPIPTLQLESTTEIV
ncbi:MAG: cupin domain-containing protein [Cyanobacteria bacterium P01_A01_bin.116]